MRKITALILILTLCFALFGCSSGNVETTEETPQLTSAPTKPTIPPTTEPETQPQETYPETGIYSGKLVLGNITFIIPDGFTATAVNETSFVLSSSDGDCSMGFSAMDISSLDEETVKSYLPMQHESFAKYGEYTVPADDIYVEIGGIPVTMNACGTLENSMMLFCADTTFTDSWYAYTFVYKSDMESENHSAYNSMLVDLLMFSEHNGREFRFDFVQ